MENEQRNQDSNGHDDTIGGAQTNTPDPEVQNDTGFAGTTNTISENHQDKDGYQIAVEDTMIGYDGNDKQMEMDLGDEDKRRSGKTGFGDND